MKTLKISMSFLHMLTDFRQIAQENVEKRSTYDNYKKCEILKIQDGGGRHLGFAKMLITSVWIEIFGCNLNCVYLDTTEIRKFHQKCNILKIQDGGRRHLGFNQNVNNFRMDWAFGLKFELLIHWHNRNWKISPKVQNFENPRWWPPPSWILPKC